MTVNLFLYINEDDSLLDIKHISTHLTLIPVYLEFYFECQYVLTKGVTKVHPETDQINKR